MLFRAATAQGAEELASVTRSGAQNLAIVQRDMMLRHERRLREMREEMGAQKPTNVTFEELPGVGTDFVWCRNGQEEEHEEGKEAGT